MERRTEGPYASADDLRTPNTSPMHSPSLRPKRQKDKETRTAAGGKSGTPSYCRAGPQGEFVSAVGSRSLPSIVLPPLAARVERNALRERSNILAKQVNAEPGKSVFHTRVERAGANGTANRSASKSAEERRRDTEFEEQLARREGWESASHKKAARSRGVWRLECHFVEGDARSWVTWAQLAGHRAVVHCSAIHAGTDYPRGSKVDQRVTPRSCVVVAQVAKALGRPPAEVASLESLAATGFTGAGGLGAAVFFAARRDAEAALAARDGLYVAGSFAATRGAPGGSRRVGLSVATLRCGSAQATRLVAAWLSQAENRDKPFWVLTDGGCWYTRLEHSPNGLCAAEPSPTPGADARGGPDPGESADAAGLPRRENRKPFVARLPSRSLGAKGPEVVLVSSRVPPARPIGRYAVAGDHQTEAARLARQRLFAPRTIL